MKHCHHSLPDLPGLILLATLVMPSVCAAQAPPGTRAPNPSGYIMGWRQKDHGDMVFHNGGTRILIDGQTDPHVICGHNVLWAIHCAVEQVGFNPTLYARQ